MSDQNDIDFYEVLEISPAAETDRIVRVVAMLEARYGPDNPVTGDARRFQLVRLAGETLLDRERRAKYDAASIRRRAQPLAVFGRQEYASGLEGEHNRRLGILALLYSRRRLSPENPGVSQLQLETRMAFPREHLAFAVAYLRERGFVREVDNNDLTITSEGVDRLESQLTVQHPLYKLLWPLEEDRAEPVSTVMPGPDNQG
jgi:curved DNA-binding protein CbpA